MNSCVFRSRVCTFPVFCRVSFFKTKVYISTFSCDENISVPGADDEWSRHDILVAIDISHDAINSCVQYIDTILFMNMMPLEWHVDLAILSVQYVILIVMYMIPPEWHVDLAIISTKHEPLGRLS
jgi:hypothetical protein